jgi:RNA polymerase sigma-70 factor, ECF subfamily
MEEERTKNNMEQIAINRDNFGQLYDEYVRKIFNFIYYKTHHKETAEDLTSDTFTKAYRKLENFDQNKGKFSTWLYQIARNTVIDFYRVKKIHVNIDDVWDLSEDIDIQRDFDTSQKLKEVKKYLKTLDACQREIVLLRVWDGLSYREISEIVGKDEVNCRVIFSRTLHTLKKEMPAAILAAMLLFKF